MSMFRPASISSCSAGWLSKYARWRCRQPGRQAGTHQHKHRSRGKTERTCSPALSHSRSHASLLPIAAHTAGHTTGSNVGQACCDEGRPHPEVASVEEGQVLHKGLLVVRAVVKSCRQVGVWRQDGCQLLGEQPEELPKMGVELRRHCQGPHLHTHAPTACVPRAKC